MLANVVETDTKVVNITLSFDVLPKRAFPFILVWLKKLGTGGPIVSVERKVTKSYRDKHFKVHSTGTLLELLSMKENDDGTVKNDISHLPKMSILEIGNTLHVIALVSPWLG